MMGQEKSEALRVRLAEMYTEVDRFPRCEGPTGMRDEYGIEIDCGKLLAEVATRPWRIKCNRCGHVNGGG